MARLFTLDEANGLLPRLREILAELARAIERLEQVEGEVSVLQWKVRGNGHKLPDEVFTRQQAEREAISDLISRINELGCELKDPRTGLLDFRSEREGEVVYLCWKLDEPRISFWHPLEAGFAGRQPL